MECSLKYPADYIKVQISPVITENKDMTKEIVWTYLIARKYKNDYPCDYAKLAEKLGVKEKMMPEKSKIWLEAYLQPTRSKEGKTWMTRADLAMGHLKEISRKENQFQSSGGEWVCIVESKWYDNMHFTSTPEKINQLLKIIEHALLLHDDQGRFPKKVYVTLVTPKYFKEGFGKFSHRDYSNIYNEYNKPGKLKLKKDLALYNLSFLNHDLETLIGRTRALILNWVTFEELLDLPNLVEHHRPGKYRVTINSWKEIFSKMGMDDQYNKLTVGTGGT